jgi:hypothetical protein
VRFSLGRKTRDNNILEGLVGLWCEGPIDKLLLLSNQIARIRLSRLALVGDWRMFGGRRRGPRRCRGARGRAAVAYGVWTHKTAAAGELAIDEGCGRASRIGV